MFPLQLAQMIFEPRCEPCLLLIIPDQLFKLQQTGAELPLRDLWQFRQFPDRYFGNTSGIPDVGFSASRTKLPTLPGVLRVYLVDMLIRFKHRCDKGTALTTSSFDTNDHVLRNCINGLQPGEELLHPILTIVKVQSAFLLFKPVDGNCRVFRWMRIYANVGHVIEIKSYVFYCVSPPFQSPKKGLFL
jgi:hypothetical protein